MLITGLICAILFLVLGISMWKFETVSLLAGVDTKNVTNPKKLAKSSGLSMIMLGLTLLVETIFIGQGLLVDKASIFTILITLIVGTMVIALVVNQNS